ncbi:Hsp70 family protein [Byssothecium circinans]|uniref:Hsp70 family protein n=1 Tax=Byssothecium circinans TaxID=147558 RepID=A0A6A5TGW8_9PLEO|nr:Hsp70 family protein [Byssothecium circinans]
MLRNRLVIGLDYGTTYTGISFCETSDTSYIEDRIQIVQDWPSAHTLVGTKEKVPSEIAYSSDGTIRWGSLIPPHVPRHMWTKLELDSPKTGEAERIRQELSALTINGADKVRHPVDIIADFLAEVKAHLIKNLDRQYGEQLWRTLPITLVVTVPAVWSDAAKDRTMQAVSKAGFNQVMFPQLKRIVTTTEPEAAALYTIKYLQGSVQDEQLAIGDGFVVCDMGGGTVDLIAYRVAGIDPTVVEEATIGSGDQCGGSFVDRAFLVWLEMKLGIEDFLKIAGCRAADLSRTSLPPKLGRMVQDFTLTAKSGFSGTEEYYLRLPAVLGAIEDEERGICDGEIQVTADDMIHMFEFPLRRTKELLQEQLRLAAGSGNASVKYIFMVGGFAESPYMHSQISELARTYTQLQAVKPVNAWSAISRGATAKGLESDGRNAVKFRKCRRHYGTGCNPIFQRGVHLESESYICKFTGVKRASNQMSWVISKGEELSTSAPLHGSVAFFMPLWPGDSRKTSLKLLAADSDIAPQRDSHKNVYEVAKLTIDLSCVPQREFQTKRSPGGDVYYHLDYTIEISVQSALEYSLSINGVKYGSVAANYA